MRRLILAAMMLSAAGARGASFDCKLAKTPLEKAICATPELSAADERMAAAYKAVVAAVPAEMKAEVLAGQRGWLKALPHVCKANDPAMVACLQNAYKLRIDSLKSSVTTRAGVTFVSRTNELTSKDALDESSPDIRQEEENPGFGTLHAQWPEALSSALEWKAWNAAVLVEVQQMSGANGAQEDGEWKNEWAAGADSNVTTTLLSAGQGRVSVHIENDYMGHGAAHPGEAGENFHWLLKEQREMKVDDVFAPGSGWAAVVNARCMTALEKQFGKDGMAYDDMPPKVADVTASTKNWELIPAGLRISFPEYSVSPRAAPADDVTVPWSALKPFLVAGFVVPQ
jgi:uncharacterized protein